MASMGFLPMEGSVLRHGGNCARPRSCFSVYRQRNVFDFVGLNYLTNEHAKIGCMKLTRGCGNARHRRIKRVKATDNGSGEGEDVDEPENALEATLEKSKKVLAKQRELLKQVIFFIDLIYALEYVITAFGLALAFTVSSSNSEVWNISVS